MWIRLPELPIKFYEHKALLKIGKAIGTVLHIDANTANGARGRFARLCVQVNLDKPLVKSIYLGRLKQSIQHEGIGTLCFECGRIGHNREVCPFLVHRNCKGLQEEHSNGSQEEQRSVATTPEVEKAPASQQDKYGDWMIVTQRKPMNRARDKLNGPSGSQTNESSHMPYEKTLPRAREVDRAAGKRKAPHFQIERSQKEESKNTLSYQKKIANGRGTNRNGARANPRQKDKTTVGNQNIVIGLGKDKGMFVFGASVGPSKDVGLDQNPFSFSKVATSEARPDITDKKGETNTLSFNNYGESREVGIILQEQNHTNQRRDDQMDKAGPNGDLGVIRFGADAGLEKYVSTDRGEQRAGLPSIDEQGMGVDPESMVEVCHRQTSSSSPSTNKLKLVSDKIKHANLEKISDQGRKGMNGTSDYCEEDSSRQACGMLYEGEFAQGENDPRSEERRVGKEC